MMETPQALAGLTVLDLSTRLPGPLATLMLAQAGARVIKIERPPGEELRGFEPRLDGLSAHYAWLNRGKECVALDFKNRDDCALFEALLGKADILVEQFRPGVMDRLGLGYEELSPRHPRLIYCAITGYGRDDHRSHEAGHDLNYQASVGLVGSAPLGARGVPTLPPVLLGDIAGGTYPAFMSILLAVLQRNLTGRGQFLDIAMARNVEVFTLWTTISGHLTGHWPQPGAARHTGGSPRYNLYAARDGKLLAVAALEERFWQNFLEGIGLALAPGLEEADPQRVIALVAERIAAQDAGTWLARLEGRDTCCNLAPEMAEAHAIKPSPAMASGLPVIPLPVAAQFTLDDAPPPVWLGNRK
ncbi:MAG TPA: CaiB/BaiF CoA-transferase family protein [Reyranella sp.]|jgi:crotonobetainyl-CoA:carnitine CoA-transferase CaiB-like acyl-CoA transferase|nr:CaiB/BaiF CoA-transferase family protein [Reyranella sp.]